MNIQTLKNSSGICLVELMIAMAAGLVVLSATIQMLTHCQQRMWDQYDTIGLHQDQRIGIGVMREELRLAGSGVPRIPAVLLRADRQEIEFNANIGGYTTNLTGTVSPEVAELPVADGTGWVKGKRVLICSNERCAENHLARDGQRTSLSLASPLGQAFPAGSEVMISNRVRYYLSKSRSGRVSLMRQVDGGANPVVSDVSLFSLSYADRHGRPTLDPAIVSRVKVELSVGRNHRVLTSEVGLRAQ